MINKNQPFFYDKKRVPLWKVLLIILGVIAILIFLGFQIPRIRQIIAKPVFSAGSYVWNGVKDIFQMSRMLPEEEKPRQTYTPLELPDRQVLFAESLENLSAIANEDPLADLRQTPTPSEYSRVAEWEYLDPNLNYAITYGNQSPLEEKEIQNIPPVFEHAKSFMFSMMRVILHYHFSFTSVTREKTWKSVSPVSIRLSISTLARCG